MINRRDLVMGLDFVAVQNRDVLSALVSDQIIFAGSIARINSNGMIERLHPLSTLADGDDQGERKKAGYETPLSL